MKYKKYKVIANYKSPYPDPIIFEKGEELQLGKEFNEDPDWKDWVWCEGTNNRKAWVPKQYIDVHSKKGILNTPYNAKELSVQVGEVLTVKKIMNGFGIAKNSIGETGWVPLRNIQIIN